MSGRDVSRALLAVALGLCLPMPAPAQDVVEYYGTDAIGSVRIVFDANGNMVGRMDYSPFGEQVTVSTVVHKSYAGLFRDGEAGLDYVQARSHQVRTGRFNAPDPVYAGLSAPQAWNRYSYALNNPLSFVDPTGLVADSCTTTETWSQDGDNWTLNTTVKCKDNNGGGGGGSGWSEFLAWVATRVGDTFTGSAVLNGPEADRVPYARYSPPRGVEAGVEIGLLAVAVVAGAKAGATGAGVATAVDTTATKAAATQALKAGLTLNSGNMKAGLEHILLRHSFNSGSENASKFLRGAGFIEIKALINEAAGGTTAWEIQGGVRVLNTNMGRVIGYDQTGSAVSGLRIVALPNGSVITAYPVR